MREDRERDLLRLLGDHAVSSVGQGQDAGVRDRPVQVLGCARGDEQVEGGGHDGGGDGWESMEVRSGSVSEDGSKLATSGSAGRGVSEGDAEPLGDLVQR